MAPLSRERMAASSIQSLSLPELCRKVKSILPLRLQKDAWYIVTATALTACQKPHEIGNLWQYLAKDIQTEEEKQRISNRLRDVFLKEWTLTGIPPIIVAIVSLAKSQGALDEAQASSSVSQHWFKTPFPSSRNKFDLSPNGELYTRGERRLQELYQQNLNPIFRSFGSHREDIELLEKSFIYGTFLSELTVLDSIEAELVVMISILCGGLKDPSIWHLRACRRLGMEEMEVDQVQEAVSTVAEWCGVSKEAIAAWPTCTDIVDEI